MAVETKVTVATVASTLTGVVVLLLGTYVFGGAVPVAVTSVVGGLVVGAVTFAAAWLAKHTPRTPPAVDTVVPLPRPGATP